MAHFPSEVVVHPQRFDPVTESGKLIDAEHRARYCWASQVVAGKRVLDAGCGLAYGSEIVAAGGAASVAAVDIDHAAVQEARRRLPDLASSIHQGDIRDLDFAEDSFDVIVCFETIEHLEDADRALVEFSRVLDDGGLLLVSSPNPAVYVSGNEHHVHEYSPPELLATIAERFRNVSSYTQGAWLASGIEPLPKATENGQNGAAPHFEAFRTDRLDARQAAFTIAVAGNGELPQLGRFAAFSDAFEVRWWSERVSDAQQEGREAVAAVERKLAQAREREATTAKRLEEANRALVDANQELAQIPLLKHRLAELHEEHAELWGRYDEIENSRSWRMTRPLRRVRAFFRA